MLCHRGSADTSADNANMPRSLRLHRGGAQTELRETQGREHLFALPATLEPAFFVLYFEQEKTKTRLR